MHDLVVGALQEGRIDRAEGLVAFGRHSGREGDGMLFGDADVERALRELFPEDVHARAGGHRGRDGHDLVVLARFLDEALAEHLGVARRVRLGLDLRARDHIEGDDAVVLVGRALGRRVALAFLGDDVDEDRPLLGVAHVLQHGQEMVEVVSVDRADVVEPQLLEQGAAGEKAARVFLGANRLVIEELRQVLGELLPDLAQVPVGAARDEAGEIRRHGADRRRDRHVVVVEDDDQARMHGARVVHGLVGHAGRHGPVADDAHDIVIAAGKVARHRHPEPGRDRGRRVGRSERIVFALGALGEAREAAAHAKRPDAVAPACEDFVRIRLMPDIPNDAVARRVEHVVERHRQLDDAQTRAKMAPGERDGVDRLGAQFLCELRELILRQTAEVLRNGSQVQKWRRDGQRTILSRGESLRWKRRS